MLKLLTLTFSNPLRITVFILVVLFIVVIITQIAIPLITNTPLFPLFSRKPKITGEINKVNEQLQEEQMLVALDKQIADLVKLRKAREQNKPLADEEVPTQPKTRTQKTRINKLGKLD